MVLVRAKTIFSFSDFQMFLVFPDDASHGSLNIAVA
jgi:hypothetical protein